jgi:hypothetical protein
MDKFSLAEMKEDQEHSTLNKILAAMKITIILIFSDYKK